MRVLVSTTSGLGHLQPVLPLAVALRSRGHEVLWATADDSRRRVEAAGIPTVSAGLVASERIPRYRAAFPEAAGMSGLELAAHMFPRLFGAIVAPAAIDDIERAIATFAPDVVVAEVAELAAPIASRRAGVPNVAHAFGGAVPVTRMRDAADFVAPLWRSRGLEPRPLGGCYDHLYIDIFPPSLQNEDVSYIERIQRVRPAEPVAVHGDAVPAAVAAVVSGDRSVVYVTFGTIFNDNVAFDAAVEALCARDDTAGVVTVGPGGDPDRFANLPSHVAVARFVPQHAILPRCAAVVTHGGSGTVLGALAHGVPVVCIPQAADQFRNAAACARADAGVAVTGDVGVTTIADALDRVLTDGSLRAGARRIADEIREMPDTDAACDAVEHVAVG